MIGLRPATSADSELLFAWVNSPSSLAGKLRTNGPIPRDDHRQWLAQRLNDPGTSIWIALDDAAVVGQVRFQRIEEAGESFYDVDIFVANDKRGRGRAKAILSAAACELAGREPGARLRALVRKENSASQRLFQSLGYRLVANQQDCLVYVGDVSRFNARAAPPRSFAKSNALYERALKTVPLATQTFSKSAMNFVKGASPLFLDRGKGCEVWDVDGNSYIDFILGLLPVLLGYCDEDVDRAIIGQLERGISFSLATELEAEVSEQLVRLIPSAEMVRFGKNGSDATTAAIRLARAVTRRNLVAVCGYHGWHDWYIGTTTRNLGVPKAVRDLSKTFDFNDVASLDRVLTADPGKFAAIILEPAGVIEPQGTFLHDVRDLATRHGALLVFDEIITGFRVALGGAQSVYGVTPDLSCFGKAMANGMPISAIVGARDHMKVMEDIFFSGTFGGEALSLAAARATIAKCERLDVPGRLASLGERLTAATTEAIDRCGLSALVGVGGPAWWPRVTLKAGESADKGVLTSLIRQEAAANGLLMGAAFNLCLAHDDAQVFEKIRKRWQDMMLAVAEAVNSRDPASHLRGEPVQPVFEVRN